MTQFAAFLYSVVLPGARMRSGQLIQFARDCRLTAPVAVGSTGNLVFKADNIAAAALEAQLEPQFAHAFGKAIPILVRTADELAAMAESHPYGRNIDPRRIAVRLQRAPVDVAWVNELSDRAGDVAWQLIGTDLWLKSSDGVWPSRLTGWIARSGPIGTFRTYGTIQRVSALCPPRGVTPRNGRSRPTMVI